MSHYFLLESKTQWLFPPGTYNSYSILVNEEHLILLQNLGLFTTGFFKVPIIIKHEDMIYHHSHVHNLSICEIKVVCITAMIIYVFISFSAVQIYILSYIIHLYDKTSVLFGLVLTSQMYKIFSVLTFFLFWITLSSVHSFPLLL